ncbi:MAG TPA: DUF4328 domain-containing protein [Actinomycetes bacterium]|nr:DUF4328 domain-containing protein [Actinomycetes bacterium]
MAATSLAVAEEPSASELPTSAPGTEDVGQSLDGIAALVAADAPAQAAAPQELVLAHAGAPAPTTPGQADEGDPPTAPLEQLVMVQPEPITLEPTPLELAEAPNNGEADSASQPTDSLPADSLPEPDEPRTEPAVSPRQRGESRFDRPGALGSLVKATAIGVAVTNLLLVAALWVTQPAAGVTRDMLPGLAILGLALVNVTAWVMCAAVFLIWVSRTHDAVTARSGIPQRHTRSMAVWGWFIPVYCLFVGWQVMQDLWAGSKPETPDASDEAGQPRQIDVWAIALFSSTILLVVSPLLLGDSLVVRFVAAACLLVAAVTLGTVVTAISAWQEASAAVPE